MQLAPSHPPPIAPPRPGGGLTVILKATDMCNAACTFCSIGPSGTHRMAWDDFEHLAEELERTVEQWKLGHLGLTFHGGEPTLLGARWIDRACERVGRIAADVSFSMQSNLVRFDDAMVEVVRRHGIRVGSSFDPLVGQRRLVNGTDAYPRWVEAYRRLSNEGLSIGAIFVVTRDAIDRVDELYDICAGLGELTEQPFGLQVNPVYAQGKARSAGGLLLDPKAYGAFLVSLWRRWEESGRSVNVTPIRQFVTAFEHPGRAEGLLCTFGKDCTTSHVGVDFDLHVAGCGRRLDAGAVLGDLRHAHLDDLVLGSEEKRWIAIRSGALRETRCAECRFYWACQGGCPDSADLGMGSLMDRFPWCESYTQLFEALERTVTPTTQRPPLRTTVRLGTRPEELRGGAVRGERVQRWLMPTADGRALGFDSPLKELLSSDTERLRLRIHNRHARALTMWNDVIRRQEVSVELFESEGLEVALNVLNALGADVTLDVPSIAEQPGGEPALEAALDRYATDPLWRVQVHPFSELLLLAVEGRRSESINRCGLVPGTFDVVWSAQGAAGGDEAPFALLRREVNRGLTDWQAAHEPCRKCPNVSFCGGRLAPDDAPCAPGVRRLVDRIGETAAVIRGQVRAGAAE